MRGGPQTRDEAGSLAAKPTSLFPDARVRRTDDDLFSVPRQRVA